MSAPRCRGVLAALEQAGFVARDGARYTLTVAAFARLERIVSVPRSRRQR